MGWDWGGALAGAAGAVGDITKGMIETEEKTLYQRRIAEMEEARNIQAEKRKAELHGKQRQDDADFADAQRNKSMGDYDARKKRLIEEATLRKAQPDYATESEIDETGTAGSRLQSIDELQDGDAQKYAPSGRDLDAIDKEAKMRSGLLSAKDIMSDDTRLTKEENALLRANLSDKRIRDIAENKDKTANRGLDMRADGTYGTGGRGSGMGREKFDAAEIHKYGSRYDDGFKIEGVSGKTIDTAGKVLFDDLYHAQIALGASPEEASSNAMKKILEARGSDEPDKWASGGYADLKAKVQAVRSAKPTPSKGKQEAPASGSSKNKSDATEKKPDTGSKIGAATPSARAAISGRDWSGADKRRWSNMNKQ